MLLSLLLALTPAHAQEVLGGSDVIVTVAPGQTGEILLDGRSTGVMAPGTLSGVRAGEHRIQVRGDCVMGMGFVTVVPGRLVWIDVALRTTGGFVEITVVPQTAVIFLDGEPIGIGPSIGAELACGDHTAEAQADAFPSQSRDFRVEMGTAQTVTLDLTLPPPAPPVPLPAPSEGLPGIRKGVSIGLAVLGVGTIGAGAWLHLTARANYADHYVPEFEACEDLACQEDLQEYRSGTIARRYYGSMIVAGVGAVSLTTAGVVGLTSDGVPVLGLTRRW